MTELDTLRKTKELYKGEQDKINKYSELVQDVFDETEDPDKAIYILTEALKESGSYLYECELLEMRHLIADAFNIQLNQWCCTGTYKETHRDMGDTEQLAYKK